MPAEFQLVKNPAGNSSVAGSTYGRIDIARFAVRRLDTGEPQSINAEFSLAWQPIAPSLGAARRFR